MVPAAPASAIRADLLRAGQPRAGPGSSRRHADADAGVVEVTVEEAFAGTKRRVAINEGGRSRQVDVQIPAGIADGQALRIGGGPGHSALLVRVKVLPHPLYQLNGKDVQIELPLAPWEAALGAKVAVPTLGGTVELHDSAGRAERPEAAVARPRHARESERGSAGDRQAGHAGRGDRQGARGVRAHEERPAVRSARGLAGARGAARRRALIGLEVRGDGPMEPG